MLSSYVTQHPKVKSASTIDDHTLLIEFDNNQKKKYDLTPLLTKEMFSPLKTPNLLKTVQVEQGGYAISWNENIDISEYELWSHGQAIP